MNGTSTDPLTDPKPLITRVYAYVAYRIGDGPEAEDVTSEVFERALRYRRSFDPAKGRPLSWLLAIASRCVQQHATRISFDHDVPDVADDSDLENDAIRRLSVRTMVSKLDDRDRELVALRYGADLTARQVGELLGMKTNAVEVAIHRALERLRRDVAHEAVETRRPQEHRLRTSSGIS
jgi:RNA polymerase sigma-70 factor, ECF subfamily